MLLGNVSEFSAKLRVRSSGCVVARLICIQLDSERQGGRENSSETWQCLHAAGVQALTFYIVQP